MNIEKQNSAAAPPSRNLKVEAQGDRWRGFRPKIRLMGLWLKRAGFLPDSRVEVVFVKRGVIQLRAFEKAHVDTDRD
jgi:hypothetical protein